MVRKISLSFHFQEKRPFTCEKFQLLYWVERLSVSVVPRRSGRGRKGVGRWPVPGSSSRLLLELDCFCLANIVAEDILGHKMLLPRTFSATSKLLPSTFSATSKLLLSTFAATNKFNLLLRKYSATTCLLPRKF